MPSPSDLKDRVAVVTGGTGALGRAVARALARAGAEVHVTWRSDAERADFVSYLARDGGGVRLHQVDVTSAESVTSLFDALRRDPGRLDILTCVAGGFSTAPAEKTPPEEWNRMFALNATSVFLCCRAAIPLLRASGRGRIVNVAARPALERGAANMSAYGASKAAVLHFTYSLAKELGPAGTTVNAIVPSIIDTPANRAAMPKANAAAWLKPEEIAEVVAFLAGDAGRIVTGSAVSLSRG